MKEVEKVGSNVIANASREQVCKQRCEPRSG
jgi:hypothetical protein